MPTIPARLLELSPHDRMQLEAWLAEFEEGWNEDRLAARVEGLPPCQPLRLPALIELVKIDLERNWQRGRRLSLADYMARYPELGAAGDLPADLRRAEDEVRRQFAELPPTLTAAPRAERAGSAIGPYKLMEQLGEGGFGLVFVAEQHQPVRRKVALKLIKPGMDSAQVIARFEAERQALAMMDHPHIAKVLDAGATDSGRPYFVMELVKGIPITEYCDKNQLAPRERLELFVTVCQAIQHAHQKGIIHRDIKPSNVLVSSHDGRPVAKVIDFGVAKAMHQQLTAQTIYTNFAQMIGTPLYMSPEQAEMSGLDIDTRSDIYSLGVLLYELLTGTTPLERQRIAQAAYDEVRRLIRDEEPPRPSLRLSSSDSLPSIAAQRHTEPAKLSRLVRGDLDWITMKALEKDRTRRYETANGLARDIQRHLSDEPVEACPPSATYRLRKFAKKHRTALATATALALLLVGGIAVSSWQAMRAMRAEAEANQAAEAARLAQADAEAQKENALQSAAREADERKKAEAAKTEAQAKEAEANAVVQFFEDKVFAAGRPKGEAGGLRHDVSLREVIKASLPALGTSFAAQPLVEARLRVTLGRTFNFLGEPASAASQDEQALALCTRHLGADHPNTLVSMHNLAESYAALNRQDEALKLRQAALAARKRVLPSDHPDTLKNMHSLAGSYAALNRHAEAIKLFEATLAAEKRVYGLDHVGTFRTMNNLANSYAALNHHAEALKLREETLAGFRRLLPPDHPDTLKGMHNLATSYENLNRHAEALKLREETLAARKRVLPPDHPDTLRSMHNLANSYAVLDRRAESVKLLEETLVAEKRVLPPDHPLTLATMHNLAAGYAALNRRAESVKLLEDALVAERRVLPPDHPHTLATMSNLAVGYAALNRHAEALPLIDELLAKADRPGIDPRLIPTAIRQRLRYFQKAGDVAAFRATAEIWEKLNRTDAAGLYNAACYRAVTASLQAKAKEPDAAQLARADADRAMVWLTKAVAAGFTNAALIRKDADLDFLRDRDDFQKLVAALESKLQKK
jgi:serine/threonine protein kinase